MLFNTLLVSSCIVGILGQQLPSNCQSACPTGIAWWAIPSDTGRYTMYRVGGGCPCSVLADPPCPSDGTWGWDYVGRCLHPNVIFGWWHGRAYQGGTGAYKTDGPSTNHGEGTLRSLVDH
jgi:hypothetical protein